MKKNRSPVYERLLIRNEKKTGALFLKGFLIRYERKQEPYFGKADDQVRKEKRCPFSS
jgi:hypothetical protein